jgi:hypothetical protein
MQMFFDGWSGIVRIVLIAPAAYLALVAMLRITGKRTLTKLNAFDLVITVALGSTLATQILSRDTPLADGVAGMAALVALQWVVTAVSVRSGLVPPPAALGAGARDAGRPVPGGGHAARAPDRKRSVAGSACERL